MSDRSEFLAHAVIRQCVTDLFVRTLSGVPSEERDIQRHLAMRFLTATGNDDWAMARRAWCGVADVDPDELRAHVIDILEGNRDLKLEENTYRLNGHNEAREMWAEEKARHIAFLDDARRQVEERRAARNVEEEADRARRRKETDAKRSARMRDAWDEATRIIDETNHRLRYANSIS
ncbi:MAG: hypothetical protein JJ938_04350 [Roseicyclus sp.]|nr:hypothetical protein [Roseicyclus sp.]MBO6624084.1 hypothetical protein [Roseicyclus sp.]MBO6923942.1 hypothetical protein [Roseicyclus sp.]